MPAPDLFGILDIVKLLTPPEGFASSDVLSPWEQPAATTVTEASRTGAASQRLGRAGPVPFGFLVIAVLSPFRFVLGVDVDTGGGVGGARVGVAREQRADELGEVGRDVRAARAEVGRVAREDGVERGGEVLVAEGVGAGEALVEGDAEDRKSVV